jgi:hypothetical protein
MSIKDLECFTSRLETFNKYTGIVDCILLARLEYYHKGDNVICCKNCKSFFITWSIETEFWEKQRIIVHL